MSLGDSMQNRLKELRKSKKLSQDEVAGYLHVTRQAVSHWETGKTKPDLNCLKKLCELYLKGKINGFRWYLFELSGVRGK